MADVDMQPAPEEPVADSMETEVVEKISGGSSSTNSAPPKAPAGTVDFEAPWVEKYRPQQLCDVQGNREIVSRLESIARDGSMPNIIIAGPPGTGKTTSILALARTLLGDCFKDAVLELNASDERGIDVVRNRIKMFAQKKVTLPPGRQKVIILDEADSMTSSAQQALRRTMELFSNTTRFALACNISSKIIEPIQSRCAILRFAKLSDQEVLNRIIQVCETESVSTENSGLEALVFSAEGDMRNALNNLQATVAGFAHVNDVNVFKVVDQPHPIKVKAIVAACLESDIYLAQSRLEELWNFGYSCYDLIGTLFKVVKYFDMPENIKLEMIREVGFTHMRIADGATSFLQLVGLLSSMCEVAQKLSTPK